MEQIQFIYFQDYMQYYTVHQLTMIIPECIIGQISWNSGGKILIKKVHFEIAGAEDQILIISEDYHKNITDQTLI